MSKVMTAALALSLLAGTSALAQSRQDGEGRQITRPGTVIQQREDAGRQAPRSDRAPAAPPQAQPAARPEDRGGRDGARPSGGWSGERPSRPEAGAPRNNGGRDQERPRAGQPGRPNDNGVRPGDNRGERPGRPEAGRPRGNGGWNGGRPDDNRGGYGNRRDRDDWSNNDYRPRDNGQNTRDRDRDRDRNWDRGTYRGDQRPGYRDRDRGRHEWRPDQWRRSYQSQRRYQAPRWTPPRGFYFRSWSFGDYLPWGWYDQQYYIWDFYRYGLPAPPIGTEWIRSGDDAILVDVWSGRVLTVYYNLFW